MTTAMIAGASLFAGASQRRPVVCAGNEFCPLDRPANEPTAKAGGVALMVIGVVAMGAGIPLVIVGAQKVPDRDGLALLPSVHIGAGSASLSWSL
jgi:hypothetical protein